MSTRPCHCYSLIPLFHLIIICSFYCSLVVIVAIVVVVVIVFANIRLLIIWLVISNRPTNLHVSLCRSQWATSTIVNNTSCY